MAFVLLMLMIAIMRNYHINCPLLRNWREGNSNNHRSTQGNIANIIIITPIISKSVVINLGHNVENQESSLKDFSLNMQNEREFCSEIDLEILMLILKIIRCKRVNWPSSLVNPWENVWKLSSLTKTNHFLSCPYSAKDMTFFCYKNIHSADHNHKNNRNHNFPWSNFIVIQQKTQNMRTELSYCSWIMICCVLSCASFDSIKDEKTEQ